MLFFYGQQGVRFVIGFCTLLSFGLAGLSFTASAQDQNHYVGDHASSTGAVENGRPSHNVQSPDATFSQQAKLLASDGAGTADSLGFSSAISGDTAILGAPRNGPSRGAAYIFVRSGSTWTQQQKLLASDAMGNDQFGYSVAISGNTAAVGRYNTTTGVNRSDGKVYIFTRSGTTWTETQTLVSNDIAQGDLFGNALALENDTLVVGARQKGPFVGAAYVFTRAAPGGAFSQQARLTSAEVQLFDFFGESVALSGDTAIIGSVNDFGTQNAIGKAYVFVRTGTTWAPQQTLQAGGTGSPNGSFGVGVAVSGNTALIGARTEAIGTGGELGAAYVFVRTGSVWAQTQRFTALEAEPRNDTFGYGVAILGDVLAIGSPQHDLSLPLPQGQINNNGAVYVYERSGGGNFARTQKLVQNDPTPGGLGQTLAIDGTSILAAQPGHDAGRGAVYIFAANPAPAFASISGRVVTPSGLGLRNAVVSLIDEQNVRTTATTSSFGLFNFPSVATGRTYTITIGSRRYRYTVRVVPVSGNLALADFIGLE